MSMNTKIHLLLFCHLFFFLENSFSFRDSIFQFGSENVFYGASFPSNMTSAKGIIIWFHGGMNSPISDKGKQALTGIYPLINRNDYIVFSPSANRNLHWLHPQLMTNINSFLREFIAKQQLEKLPIILFGVSDGSLAVIHFSINSPFNITKRLLFSSAPQIILNQKNYSQDGFQKGHWHFFQGGNDRLFPIEKIEPVFKEWKKQNPNTSLYIFPDGLHDFSYYLDNHKSTILQILSGN